MRPYGADRCVDRKWMHHHHRWPRDRVDHVRIVRSERKRARRIAREECMTQNIHAEGRVAICPDCEEKEP